MGTLGIAEKFLDCVPSSFRHAGAGTGDEVNWCDDGFGAWP